MIILINGSINSGKTSVSKELVNKLPRAAHIEIDSLREFIRSVDLNEAIPINIENTILVAKNLLKNKFNIIISYPLPKKTTLQIVNGLSSLDPEIYYFSLSPNLDKALQNRGERELTDSEKERISYHYEKGVNDPGFGIVINNSEQSINDTVEEIMKNIEEKRTLDINSIQR